MITLQSELEIINQYTVMKEEAQQKCDKFSTK